jgi:DNA-binding response OmpR family regulator
MTCPCCGRPYDRSIGVDLGSNRLYCAGAVVQLTPAEAELGHMLVENYPRTVSHESLIWGLYGPGEQKHKNTDAIVKVIVSKLRRKIAPVGLVIEVGQRRGYRLTVRPLAKPDEMR